MDGRIFPVQHLVIQLQYACAEGFRSKALTGISGILRQRAEQGAVVEQLTQAVYAFGQGRVLKAVFSVLDNAVNGAVLTGDYRKAV